jgi:hypothetical protein
LDFRLIRINCENAIELCAFHLQHPTRNNEFSNDPAASGQAILVAGHDDRKNKERATVTHTVPNVLVPRIQLRR